MSNIYETVNGNTQYYELSANAPIEVDGDCEDLFAFVLEREDLAGLTSGGHDIEHFNGNNKMRSNKIYSDSGVYTAIMCIVVALIIMFIYLSFSNCDTSSTYNTRPTFRLMSPEMGHNFRATFVH
jgi:hypothetical protein